MNGSWDMLGKVLGKHGIVECDEETIASPLIHRRCLQGSKTNWLAGRGAQ
jgi:hypothetical protein